MKSPSRIPCATAKPAMWQTLASAAALAAVMLSATLLATIAPPAAVAAEMRLRPQVIQDPMMGNEEALRLLVPANWTVEGGIVWRPELATLAYLQLRIRDPRGPNSLEVFGAPPYTWNERGYLGFPPGSLYLGAYVVRPIEPAEYVARVLLPQVRGSLSPRIVGTEALPQLAAQIAPLVQEPGATKQVLASRTRIEYVDGGRPVEEDFYCVNVYAQTSLTPGITFWGPDRLFSFRAAKGRLDRQAPLLLAITSSATVGKVWLSRYLQVREQWFRNQMGAIRRAGELSRQLAQTSAQISEDSQRAWEARQASQDRSNEAFAEYVRGVETYHDPFEGREVQLPSGYGDVWISRNGEYVLGNDPNFNPNVSMNGTWERVEPTRH